MANSRDLVLSNRDLETNKKNKVTNAAANCGGYMEQDRIAGYMKTKASTSLNNQSDEVSAMLELGGRFAHWYLDFWTWHTAIDCGEL